MWPSRILGVGLLLSLAVPVAAQSDGSGELPEEWELEDLAPSHTERSQSEVPWGAWETESFSGPSAPTRWMQIGPDFFTDTEDLVGELRFGMRFDDPAMMMFGDGSTPDWWEADPTLYAQFETIYSITRRLELRLRAAIEAEDDSAGALAGIAIVWWFSRHVGLAFGLEAGVYRNTDPWEEVYRPFDETEALINELHGDGETDADRVWDLVFEYGFSLITE